MTTTPTRAERLFYANARQAQKHARLSGVQGLSPRDVEVLAKIALKHSPSATARWAETYLVLHRPDLARAPYAIRAAIKAARWLAVANRDIGEDVATRLVVTWKKIVRGIMS